MVKEVRAEREERKEGSAVEEAEEEGEEEGEEGLFFKPTEDE